MMHPLAWVRARVTAAKRGQAEGRLIEIDDDGERRIATRRIRGGHDDAHRAAGRRAPRDELGNQPALAGARGTRDEHGQPAIGCDRALEPDLELRKLHRSSHEPAPTLEPRPVALPESTWTDHL